jgi:hypothetical protein
VNLAPVPAGAQIDAALARLIKAGCRAVGAAYVLVTSLADTPAATPGFLPTRTAPASARPACCAHPARRSRPLS